MSHATFHSGTKNASSWALRAWLALRAADVRFEEIVVDIRRPQRFANLERMADFSPSATVPALVVGDRVIFDSIAIMEFANDACGGRLLPQDMLARAEARSLMAWQHAGLSGICARISFESAFYPRKRLLTESEQSEAARVFKALESILGRSPGPFLYGAIGLADFMLAPLAIRLYRHDADTGQWPLSAEWMRSIMQNALVGEWLEEADALPHVWYDDYLLVDSPSPRIRWREDASTENRLRDPHGFGDRR